MTEAFNQAISGKLASRKMDISTKKQEKPVDPGELVQQANAALEALQAAVAELAELAAEPHEDGPGEDEGA